MRTLGLALGLVLLAPSASAEIKKDQPLWEQVDALVCVGQSLLRCMDDECQKNDSGALWKVDFSRWRIEFLTSIKSTYDIRDRFFKFYPTIDSSKHTIFFHGRLMDFNLDAMTFGEIEAQVVDSNWLEDKFPEIQSMTYKCHIQ